LKFFFLKRRCQVQKNDTDISQFCQPSFSVGSDISEN
jgi:hypothetical protein